MTTLVAEQFWQFSCASYACKGMQELLLDLQNTHHKNVNLCLLLLYLEQQKIQLTQSQCQLLIVICHQVDTQILSKQRQLRQALKNNYQTHSYYATLRKQLLDAELSLEKFQQQLLVEQLNTQTLSTHASPSNLTLYIGAQQADTIKRRYYEANNAS